MQRARRRAVGTPKVVQQCQELRAIAGAVTYGWGMSPAHVRIGATTWKTSLFPKDGGYIVPIRVSAQRAEKLSVGDVVTLRLDSERYGRTELPVILAEAQAIFPRARLPEGWEMR